MARTGGREPNEEEIRRADVRDSLHLLFMAIRRAVLSPVEATLQIQQRRPLLLLVGQKGRWLVHQGTLARASDKDAPFLRREIAPSLQNPGKDTPGLCSVSEFRLPNRRYTMNILSRIAVYEESQSPHFHARSTNKLTDLLHLHTVFTSISGFLGSRGPQN